MQITKVFRFEAAHRLRFHNGPCRNIHGHSYRVEVTLEGTVSSRGMVLDLGELSRIVKSILLGDQKKRKPWDHSIILQKDDEFITTLRNRKMNVTVMDEDPTAENMASLFAELVDIVLTEEGRHTVRVRRVSVWETETGMAIWDRYDNQGLK